MRSATGHAGGTSTQPAIPLWPGVLMAAIVGVVYLLGASKGTLHFRPSLFPHHILIADAWLHGQLNVRDEIIRQRNEDYAQRYIAAVNEQLRAQGRQLAEADLPAIRAQETAPSGRDWSVVDGKYYGYWGPMVPALLLPYVAVAGLDASDMLVSCLVGMVNVYLTFLMLREAQRAGFLAIDASTCAVLAAFLGLGTVHFFLTVAGEVWFLSQTVALLFVTLAIRLLLRSRGDRVWLVLSGTALGAAVLSRSAVAVTAPFFFGMLLAAAPGDGENRWRRRVGRIVAFAIPLGGAVLISLAYNYARFGDPFETGVHIQFLTGADPQFRQDYIDHGPFSLYYVPRNIYYYFLNLQLGRDAVTHAITFDPFGNSMFLFTPALMLGLLSVRRRDWFTVCLWMGTVTCMITLLLFEGSGWYGFGNRYLLDLMPLAILLIAIGMEGRLSLGAVLLIGLSIAANAWGTYRFCLEQF